MRSSTTTLKIPRTLVTHSENITMKNSGSPSGETNQKMKWKGNGRTFQEEAFLLKPADDVANLHKQERSLRTKDHANELTLQKGGEKEE